MKKTFNDYIKIGLTLAIIAGMFMPYVYDVKPIDVLFENVSDLEAVFGLTIPLLVIVPFLLMLIFKERVNAALIKVLKPVFLILYVMILTDYGYGIYSSYGSWLFDESLMFVIAMALSLILILFNLKYSVTKSDELERLFLAIIGLPIILYFAFGITTDIHEINFGGYLISTSFFVLYIMALFSIFKHGKLHKQQNQAE